MSTAPRPGGVTSSWLPRTARIDEVVVELPNVTTLRLSPVSESFPQFLPGQFNMVYMPGF